jgi:sec-independent protein translocase protein TatB
MTGAIQAASISIGDTLFIMLLALVVFGPRRLPEIGRQIGKLMYEFRKASNEFKYQMEEEMRKAEEEERRKKLDAENRALYPALGVTAVTTDSSTATTGSTASSTISGAEEPAGLLIQPPSTGETVIRGKSMSQLTAEAEAAATRPVEKPVKPPAKPKAPKKADANAPSAKTANQTSEAKPKKSAAKKKAVTNG